MSMQEHSVLTLDSLYGMIAHIYNDRELGTLEGSNFF